MDTKIELRPEDSKVRESILKIMRQKDFSPSTYILTLGHLLDLHKDTLKDDLEFWRQYLQYVPLIALENPNQYISLRSCVQHLAERVPELDFSAMIGYLEERYEKPYLKLAERKEEAL